MTAKDSDWSISPKPFRAGLPDRATAIVKLVCDLRDVDYSEIMGQSRVRHIAHARQEVMWMLRAMEPQPSLPRIGRWIGGRDHTTCLHAIRTHQARIDARG